MRSPHVPVRRSGTGYPPGFAGASGYSPRIIITPPGAVQGIHSMSTLPSTATISISTLCPASSQLAD